MTSICRNCIHWSKQRVSDKKGTCQLHRVLTISGATCPDITLRIKGGK